MSTTIERQAPAYRSRKGDLVAIELRETSTSVSQGLKVTTSWVLGVVEQATRDGWVAKVSWDREPNHDPDDRWSRPWRRTEHVRVTGRKLPAYARLTPVLQVLIIARDRVHFRDALLIITQGRQYKTADELRSVARPCLWPEKR